MRGQAYVKWLGMAAVLVLALWTGTADYAQLAQDKGVEAARFTVGNPPKETVRLKIWATLPKDTKIEVTIGPNKITFTWTDEAVQQGFLDTGHLEITGAEVLAKVLYDKTPNECRISINQVPQGSYKVFCSDVRAPETRPDLSPPANSYGWNRTDVTVTLRAEDERDGSGVKEVCYRLSGATSRGLACQAGSTVSFTVSNEGTTTVSYFARDHVGNQESEKSFDVKIDRTRPSISLSPSSGTYTSSFTASWSVSDSLSGVASCSVYIDGSAYSSRCEGSYEFTSYGSRSIRVEAVDRAGNTNSESRSFTLLSPARFRVDRCDIPGSANVNRSVTLSARVTNTGGSSGSQYIRLLIDGRRVDSRYVSLGPGQSETVSFPYSFSSTGRYSVRIESDDDYCSGSISIIRPSSPPRITGIIAGTVCLPFVGCQTAYSISFEDADGDVQYLRHSWTGPSSGSRDLYVGEVLAGKTSGTLVVAWVGCQPANAVWQDTFILIDGDGNRSNSSTVTTSGYAKWCQGFIILK